MQVKQNKFSTSSNGVWASLKALTRSADNALSRITRHFYSGSFNLLRWFSALALVSILLMTVTLATVVSRFMDKNMMQRDAAITMEFVDVIVQSANSKQAGEMPKPSTFFSSPLEGYLAGDKKHYSQEIEEIFGRIAALPEVLRTNIFARDTQIIWSSDKTLIGKGFNNNPRLKQALNGEVVIEVGTIGEKGYESVGMKYGKSGTQFVENYIPLWDADKQRVIGVAELYRSTQGIVAANSRGRFFVWCATITGGIILYSILFGIVWRANRVIQRQQVKLVDSETFAATGEIAAAVAHSLRNSLASIRTSAELSLEANEGISDRTPLQDIIDQTDRLEAWIRELLGYSRSCVHTLGEVEVNSVIAGSLEAFSQQIQSKSIKLTVQKEKDLQLGASNAAALGQVLNIAISNALDAMAEGGELCVSSHLNGDGRWLEVAVSDNGGGIPLAVQEKIFDPFFSTKSHGVGMGLHLAKRILKRQGGNLSVSSVEGKGAKLTVHIPLNGE